MIFHFFLYRFHFLYFFLHYIPHGLASMVMYDFFHLMESYIYFCLSDHSSHGCSLSRKIRINMSDCLYTWVFHSQHSDRGYLLYYTRVYNSNISLFFIYLFIFDYIN